MKQCNNVTRSQKKYTQEVHFARARAIDSQTTLFKVAII